MANETPADKPKLPLGLRVVFGLSLALNLLVVGALVGAGLRPDPPGRDLGARMSLGRVLYKELPREDRRTLRREVRQRVDRETLRQANVGSELYDALRADPFDADTINQLMDRQAQAQRTGQAAMRAGWIKVLSRMSTAERMAYAERLRQAARAQPAAKD